MTNYQIRKIKVDDLSQVVGLLDNILDKLSIGKGELAAALCIDRATLSRIYKGKQPATESFVLTATLLLENIQIKSELEELKERGPGKPLLTQIADLIQKNHDLEALAKGKYLDFKPSHLAVNDKPPPSKKENRPRTAPPPNSAPPEIPPEPEDLWEEGK